MNTARRELTLRHEERAAPYLVQTVAAFCRVFSDYCFLWEHARNTRVGLHAEACRVMDTVSPTSAVLFFASPDGQSLKLTHLVPARVPTHAVAVHNEIVELLAACLARFCRAYDPKLHVELTVAEGAEPAT